MVHSCTSSFGCRFIRSSRSLSFSSLRSPCVYLHTTLCARNGRGNFFAFFSMPKTPDLNASAVKRTFHEMQRRVHPDSAENEKSAENAEESVYANAAYRTLRDPFLRCKYILRLHCAEQEKGRALSAAEEEALMHEETDRRSSSSSNISNNNNNSNNKRGEWMEVALDEAFLMEMMEANETIFSADATEAEGHAALKSVFVEMEERDEKYYSKAKEHWKRGEWSEFRQCVLEWTYIRNALNNARDRIT